MVTGSSKTSVSSCSTVDSLAVHSDMTASGTISGVYLASDMILVNISVLFTFFFVGVVENVISFMKKNELRFLLMLNVEDELRMKNSPTVINKFL